MSPHRLASSRGERAKHARLVTGAVLPAFNNPLKLVGELAMLDGLSDWRLDAGFARAFLLKGASTKDYPGYDRMIAQISKETFEDQIAKGVGLVGTPGDVIEMLRAYASEVGGFESASLHVLPSTMPAAARAMRHFASEAMPKLAAL